MVRWIQREGAVDRSPCQREKEKLECVHWNRMRCQFEVENNLILEYLIGWMSFDSAENEFYDMKDLRFQSALGCNRNTIGMG